MLDELYSTFVYVNHKCLSVCVCVCVCVANVGLKNQAEIGVRPCQQDVEKREKFYDNLLKKYDE